MTMPVDVKAIIYAENHRRSRLWDEQKLFPLCHSNRSTYRFVVGIGDPSNPGPSVVGFRQGL